MARPGSPPGKLDHAETAKPSYARPGNLSDIPYIVTPDFEPPRPCSQKCPGVCRPPW